MNLTRQNFLPARISNSDKSNLKGLVVFKTYSVAASNAVAAFVSHENPGVKRTWRIPSHIATEITSLLNRKKDRKPPAPVEFGIWTGSINIKAGNKNISFPNSAHLEDVKAQVQNFVSKNDAIAIMLFNPRLLKEAVDFICECTKHMKDPVVKLTAYKNDNNNNPQALRMDALTSDGQHCTSLVMPYAFDKEIGENLEYDYYSAEESCKADRDPESQPA